MELNIKLLENQEYYNTKKNYTSDSGFDLYVLEDIVCSPWKTTKLDFKIQVQPITQDNNPQGYYLYARSSIVKTPLQMANSCGIIDYLYRGNIMAFVRNLSPDEYIIKKGTSLFQLCSADLKPFTKINFVEELDKTERGEGGFGSTNNKN
jgi:dUTP pyrophosphatase